MIKIVLKNRVECWKNTKPARKSTTEPRIMPHIKFTINSGNHTSAAIYYSMSYDMWQVTSTLKHNHVILQYNLKSPSCRFIFTGCCQTCSLHAQLCIYLDNFWNPYNNKQELSNLPCPSLTEITQLILSHIKFFWAKANNSSALSGNNCRFRQLYSFNGMWRHWVIGKLLLAS